MSLALCICPSITRHIGMDDQETSKRLMSLTSKFRDQIFFVVLCLIYRW